MSKHRIVSLLLVLFVFFIGYFFSYNNKHPFKFGLDLSGGTELTYKADLSKIKTNDVDGAMSSLRDVIERRINIFGVSEPIVQVEKPSLVVGSDDYRLLVGLPGIKNIDEAIELIGKTPKLEFMLVKDGVNTLSQEELKTKSSEEIFLKTGLDGQYLDKAQLEFSSNGSGKISGDPIVAVSFNDQGKDLFAQITKDNIGKVLAIFLDNELISSPVIRDEIRDGKAVISGGFTPEEAKSLVRDLNYGALPVPIELISTQSIGASLGVDAKLSGINAGVWGFILIVLFLILWYRLPGLVASFSLVVYIILSLAVFKFIPVTLTAAGIAGFILSIGMAVDANVLIFERTKEELKKGKSITDSLHEGFSRAWLSIRDSNISSIITAVILFWLGTSAVKGFALTLGIGVLISMFTAITMSRTFLFAIAPKNNSHGKLARFLFNNGLHF